MQCNNCGGTMIGDGFSSVEHCENAEVDSYWYNAPDDGPVYCEEDLKPDLVVGLEE